MDNLTVILSIQNIGELLLELDTVTMTMNVGNAKYTSEKMNSFLCGNVLLIAIAPQRPFVILLGFSASI